MRVFSSKSYCCFICSSKSSIRIYSPCPLRLEDTQNVSSTPLPVSHAMGVESSDGKAEAVQNQHADGRVEVSSKSSFKKSSGSEPTELGKGRVKWMDDIGKELAEIREFESMEMGDSEGDDDGDGDDKPACICVIQ